MQTAAWATKGDRFAEVIEDATGRRVIGFMSGNQQHPDLMCEVFTLAPTGLLDEHEVLPDPVSPVRHQNKAVHPSYKSVIVC